MIIIAGVGISGGSFYYINKMYGENINLKSVPAIARDMKIYEEIKYEDIKYIKVPVEQDMTNFVQSVDGCIGKVTNTTLKANSLILKNQLSLKTATKDKEYVTIKMNYAQTGGAKAGDIVDIYKVSALQSEWVANIESALILKDVLVLEVGDSEGNTKTEGAGMGMSLTNTSSKTEVVKLCVESGQASKIVIGSVDPNSGLVLVVKSR